jgi:hypothetical protein
LGPNARPKRIVLEHKTHYPWIQENWILKQDPLALGPEPGPK